MTRQTFARATASAFLPALMIAASIAGPSQAQGCPANLSALNSQVQTPSLRARLSLPLEPIIERAGGLDQAIIRTRGALADAQTRRAQAAANGRNTQMLDDAILIFTRQIEALECRQRAG